ncbi:hypothetical protein DAETH_17090 [Deinococcus aetherius]|uniref:KTSC domain-containing protein n=1 Tax=Deinococcus aetherius TaxID=200252 RepID=A0ABN6RED7_9DEIO|nr:KTSC domain-containing protein [Deinococcus aetherius]BDP41740.1 hypothetical protein DAETH_17090 [Deinococcus aetherius]
MGVTLYPVDSSMMSHVGYDEATQTLTILFQSGKRYEDSGVEKAVFDGLRGASSPGSSFNDLIADCHPYRQIRTRGRP